MARTRQSQQAESNVETAIPWDGDNQYRGISWDDYILEGGYESLWSGDYNNQILETILYARSFSSPPTGFRFTFPVNIDPPQSLPGATILNWHQNHIDGGTWELGSKIRIVWQGLPEDGYPFGRRAYRDYNVKQFKLNMLNVGASGSVTGNLLNRLQNIVQSVTPDFVGDLFDYFQDYMVGKIAVIQPGATNIYVPSAIATKESAEQSTREAYMGSASGGSNNGNNGNNGKKSLLPWIAAALAAKFLF